MFSMPFRPPSVLTGSRLHRKEKILADAQKNSPPSDKPGDARRGQLTAPLLSTSTNSYFLRR